MKTRLNLAILFVAVLVFVTSCKQAGQQGATETSSEKLSEEDIKAGIEAVVFPLPEPMSVYQMLQEIGAVYVGDILNPVASIDNYHASNIKATNLGVYAADLSYATVYDKKSDTDTYKQALKTLINDLDIKIDYKTLVSEETKEKAENIDSLIDLTSKIFYDTYEFLYNESDPALAALMVNGYYIEGLYIATHISKDTYDNVEMVKIIYGQAEPLEKLLELNSKFEGNQYIETLQSALSKLKTQYDATDGSLTKEQLDEITSTIESIRASLIS
jgi:hypothetical protein